MSKRTHHRRHRHPQRQRHMCVCHVTGRRLHRMSYCVWETPPAVYTSPLLALQQHTAEHSQHNCTAQIGLAPHKSSTGLPPLAQHTCTKARKHVVACAAAHEHARASGRLLVCRDRNRQMLWTAQKQMPVRMHVKKCQANQAEQIANFFVFFIAFYPFFWATVFSVLAANTDAALHTRMPGER